MNTVSKGILGVALLALVPFSSIGSVRAQSTISPTQAVPSASASATPTVAQSTASANSQSQSSGVATVTTKELSGEVVKVESNKITIKSDDGTKELVLGGSLKITRDGNDASQSDIKPGDTVKATINQNDNQVLALAATSKAQDKATRNAITAIAGLLILGLILYWLIKKMRKQSIKTTTHTS